MTDSPGEKPISNDNPPSDQASPKPEAPWGEDFNPERAWTTIQNLRQFEREAKALQSKLAKLEADQEAAKRAEMTELERLRADLEAERAARAQAEEQRKADLIRTHVITAAAKLGFNDPQDAWTMLDKSGLQLDESGMVAGLEQALQALAKSKPYLTTAARPAPLSATNPAGGKPTSEEQMRQELFGRKTPGIFTGGGVLWPNE